MVKKDWVQDASFLKRVVSRPRVVISELLMPIALPVKRLRGKIFQNEYWMSDEKPLAIIQIWNAVSITKHTMMTMDMMRSLVGSTLSKSIH